MFAKQQKGSPSPSKPSAPASEQAQPETQPQFVSQSSGESQVSSQFPTTPVGKRKASALEDSGLKKPQGSPTKRPRLGSASPRKGGASPTVSICLLSTTFPTHWHCHRRLLETERWTDVKHHRFLCKESPFMMVWHPYVCAIHTWALFRSHLSLASFSNVASKSPFAMYHNSKLPNPLNAEDLRRGGIGSEKAGTPWSPPPPTTHQPTDRNLFLRWLDFQPYATMSSVELYASAIQEFLQTTTESSCSAIAQAFEQLVPPELRFQVALHILWPSMRSGKRLVSWRQIPRAIAESESGRGRGGKGPFVLLYQWSPLQCIVIRRDCNEHAS